MRLILVLDEALRRPSRPPPLPVAQMIEHKPLRPWWAQAALYSAVNALGLVAIYLLATSSVQMIVGILQGRGGV